MELIPHESFGPVRLGSQREEVRSALGTPSAVQDAYERWNIQFPDQDYFSNNAISVDYNSDREVELISVSVSEGLRISLRGLTVSEIRADELLEGLDELYTLRIEEGGCTVVLEGQDVSFWRSDADATVFDVVSAGRRGYFD